MLRRSIIIVCMVLTWLPIAQAEIYRCTDAEGNAMFSQTPCDDERPEPAEAAAEQEPAVSSVEAEPEPRDEAAIAECKQPYRDAIDAVEAEMHEGYSAEQGEVFKQRLRGLTEQLRRCET